MGLVSHFSVGLLVLSVFVNLNLTDAQGGGYDYSGPAGPVDAVGDDIFWGTRLGNLKGKIEASRSGKKYYSFKGIPYAEKTPRFTVSQPVKPWEGMRDAVKAGSVCPQVDLFTMQIVGDEDCLYLNVFVPASDRCHEEGTRLPVLFFIHGGAYVMGSGDLYGPNYLMDECIVLVTINYRLGALGFLTTGEDNLIPGNLALKDQVLALKWVNQNIDSFHGDAQSITIDGFSAGACSVSHHITSPLTRGLFQRAIAQSGSVLIPGCVFLGSPIKYAETTANFLNCSYTSREEMVQCLKGADYKGLVMYQEAGKKWNQDQYTFGPVIEPEYSAAYSQDHQPFQTKHPYKRMISGDFNQVPVMTGFMKDEGILLQAAALLLNPKAIQDLNSDWNRVAPITLYYDQLGLSTEESNDISTKIRQFYFGDQPIGESTRQNLIDLDSDRYFVQETFASCNLLAKYVPVYQYVFTYKGIFSYAQLFFKYPEVAVTHTDDTQYLHDTPGLMAPSLPEGSEARMMSENVVKLWTSFVKTGKPTVSWQPNVDWTPLDPSGRNRRTLKIDLPAEILPDYLEERKQFWENLHLRDLEFRNQFRDQYYNQTSGGY